MTRKHVVLLTTGGTIASKTSEAGLNISGALSGDVLFERVVLPPESDIEVEVRSILQKPSNAITQADLIEIQQLCQHLANDPNVAGIVITHGTDTLEETAHFLDITLSFKHCALVVTGSQRAPHEEGTDAFRNIANAIIVAAHPAMQGLGALVVFNESIYAARHVRKMNTYQVNAFESPGYGKLGYVDGLRACLVQRPVRAKTLALGESLPRVDILPAYLDASSDLIDAAVDGGAQGLVLEGLGRGHVPTSWLESIGRATGRGLPVLITSACHQGPVHRSYEFPGSLASLETQGAFAVRDLSARKARLSLAVLLSTHSNEDISSRLKQLNNDP
ncbi:asparaginase [Halomonas sp. M20]|uniref:asparaginase n=1 Tax=Halomonas sp. M20 TaxID=2763264 RepID=UPI001D0A9A5B|nr:asparaginase [Halomonas sp. M20]